MTLTPQQLDHLEQKAKATDVAEPDADADRETWASAFDKLRDAQLALGARGRDILHLVAVYRAALAWAEAERERDETVALMGYASSSDDYSAACTLLPRIGEKRDAAIAALTAALRGAP